MKSRISQSFEQLERDSKKALIPFVMPGIPPGSDTLDLVLSLEDLGCNIVEIGIPFSDPIADGPVIQRASSLALKQGFHTDRVFELASRIRCRSTIPLVLLAYYNCIFSYGVKDFIGCCIKSGVDGLIIPDLPFEERDEINDFIRGVDIDVITLAAPNSGSRLKKILPGARGFVYCISTAGVTGERGQFSPGLLRFLEDIKGIVTAPRAVGFGVSGIQQIKSIRDHCEGVIVGSALQRRLMEEGMGEATEFMKGLRRSLD